MARTPLLDRLKRFVVVCGHYGCGKTNLSINLALDFAAAGEKVTLADLDIVNPYFRTSDYRSMLTERGIRVIGPNYANTNLDTPSLPPEMALLFEQDGTVVLDVGGDDAGATALGRYARQFATVEYDLLYVVNRYRSLTTTPQEAAILLPEIERASGLKATAVVNNSHLKQQTTAEHIRQSVPFACETAQQLGLPLLFTTVPASASLTDSVWADIPDPYPVQTVVRTPWEE